VLRYRVMAYITGVVLLVLCFVGIPLQVAAHNDIIVNDVGTVHGILYMIYLVVAYLLTRRLRLAMERRASRKKGLAWPYGDARPSLPITPPCKNTRPSASPFNGPQPRTISAMCGRSSASACAIQASSVRRWPTT